MSKHSKLLKGAKAKTAKSVQLPDPPAVVTLPTETTQAAPEPISQPTEPTVVIEPAAQAVTQTEVKDEAQAEIDRWGLNKATEDLSEVIPEVKAAVEDYIGHPVQPQPRSRIIELKPATLADIDDEPTPIIDRIKAYFAKRRATKATTDITERTSWSISIRLIWAIVCTWLARQVRRIFSYTTLAYVITSALAALLLLVGVDYLLSFVFYDDSRTALITIQGVGLSIVDVVTFATIVLYSMIIFMLTLIVGGTLAKQFKHKSPAPF
jgi:hypothetical protein